MSEMISEIAADCLAPVGKSDQPAITISLGFHEFLGDQKSRFSPKSKDFLEVQEHHRSLQVVPGKLLAWSWRRIRRHHQGGTYCGTFGPEDATVGYWEFLGYYMRCKVICGKETKQAAITVTKKLAKWLSDKGYVKDTGTAQVPEKEAVED